MLDRYKYLETDDFDLSRYVHSLQSMALEPLPKRTRRPRIHTSASLFDHSDFQLYSFSYSDALTLTAETENDHYWLALPVEVRSPQKVSLLNRQSRLASPGAPHPLELPANLRSLGFCLKQHTLQRYLQTYLGRDLNTLLKFLPDFDLGRAAHRAIGQMIIMLVEEDSLDPTILSDTARVSSFLSSVTHTMLLYCANNYSSELNKGSAAPAPRDVKRVLDFVHCYAEAPITLETLVRVAGVPGRTLNEHFRNYSGYSPMNYLRLVRLRNARRLLLSGTTNVTDVCLQCGFTHLGRFSQNYFAEFGELPSRTLANANA